ncbi:MAG: hypothetical protein M1830_001969 [Pleopsidium flavum]|nr:MAG: hypothetical protein M1830_001969 [Pleopsidium flavum]
MGILSHLSQISSLAFFAASAFAAPAEPAHALAARHFDFQCNHDQLMIAQEFATFQGLASAGKGVFAASPYYQTLFSDKNKNTPGFELAVQTKYTKLAALFPDQNYKVAVTCVTDQCVDQNGNNLFAWTSPTGKTINLCPSWFDNSKKAKAADVVTQCQPGNAHTGNWAKLSQFKKTKAFTILHETTHLDYATGHLDSRARDYAYGLKKCKALAKGTHKNPGLCGTGNCDEAFAFTNSDTLAFVAAGEYYSHVCSKAVSVSDVFGDIFGGDQSVEDNDNVEIITVIPLPAKPPT